MQKAGKNLAYLVLEDVNIQVAERQLVTAGSPIVVHLKGDGDIEMICGRSHLDAGRC